MKRIILAASLLCISVFFAQNSSAKGYSLSTNKVTITKTDSTVPDILQIPVQNTTSNILSVKWIMLHNDFVNTGWTYNYCDLNTCYLTPSTTPSSSTDVMDANGTSAFSVTVSHYNNAASSATMIIALWDVNDSAAKDTVTFTVEASRLAVANPVQQIAGIRFFPCPATDFLNIDVPELNPGIYNVKISNVIGAEVASYKLDRLNTRIPVSALPKGIYLVSVSDNAGRISTERFTKE